MPRYLSHRLPEAVGRHEGILNTPRMKTNAYIKIVASAELSEMKLDELTGRRGFIVEELHLRKSKMKGDMVLLEESYLDEFLWFIPESAIAYE